jgi:hypothetical protein
MPITTAQYTVGNNSKIITAQSELGAAGLLNAVDSAITSLGWTAYDTVATSIFSPLITKVYRCLNADGVTFKYFIITWDLIKLVFYTSTCEVWSSAAITNSQHYPINQSFTGGGVYVHGFDPANCFIIVSATTRHIMIWPWINNTPGLWSAIMEFERVAPEDTASLYAPGGSLRFDGSTGFISTPAAANLQLGGAGGIFTVEGWFLPNVANKATQQVIVGQGNLSSGANTNWAVFLQNGFFVFQYNLSGSVTTITNGTPVIPGRWSNFAVTSDGTTVRVFLNGLLFGTTALVSNIPTNSLPTTVGAADGGLFFFDGFITNLRILKGTVLYTANYTTNTYYQNNWTPATNIANTQLLLRVASSDAYITDTSANNLTFTVTGTVTYSNQTLFSGGSPCYAWTSSLTIGTPSDNTAAPANGGSFAFPRLPNGYLNLAGKDGAIGMLPVTNKGRMPFFDSTVTVTNSDSSNFGHLASYHTSLTYPWDLTGLKVPISSIATDHGATTLPYGRAFNFGVMRPIGTTGDTIYANVDPVGGWPSSNVTTSTSTECFVLPMNGGSEYSFQGLGRQYTGGTQTAVSSTAFSNASYSTKTFIIGDNMWICSGLGLYTLSVSGGLGGTPLQRVNSATGNVALGFYDMVYDGNRTIWVSTSNGVGKVDTITSVATYYTNSITRANGTAYLGIDNKNVYATNRNWDVRPWCVVVDQATGEIGVANVMTPGTATLVATGLGTPVPDYTGNVFLVNQAGTVSTQTIYINQFSANTGARFSNVLAPSTNNVTNMIGGSNLWYDYSASSPLSQLSGDARGGLWYIATTFSSQQFFSGLLYTGNVTLFQGATASTGVVNLANNYFTNQIPNFGALDYRADLNLWPQRGYLFGTPKRVAQSLNAATPNFTLTLIRSTSSSVTSVFNNTNAGYGAISALFTADPRGNAMYVGTDGTRVFGLSNNTSGQSFATLIVGFYGTLTSGPVPNSGSRLVLRG